MVIINIEYAMKQEFLNCWNPEFLEFPWSRLLLKPKSDKVRQIDCRAEI